MADLYGGSSKDDQSASRLAERAQWDQHGGALWCGWKPVEEQAAEVEGENKEREG